MPTRPVVLITGAGRGIGAAAAALAAARGYDVAVYERRGQDGHAPPESGRSINLGLSARGLRALSQVGLRERVLEGAVRARGRVIHTPSGALTVAIQRVQRGF